MKGKKRKKMKGTNICHLYIMFKGTNICQLYIMFKILSSFTTLL